MGILGIILPCIWASSQLLELEEVHNEVSHQLTLSLTRQLHVKIELADVFIPGDDLYFLWL